MSHTKNALVIAPQAQKRVNPLSPYTPLMSLDIVALDLKTTHTDLKQAAVVQIGAVKIRNGLIDEIGVFERLINPLQPISQACSQTHNLRDHDVIDRPDFSQSKSAFEQFLNGHVVISHQSDLHLAALKNTYAMLHLKWTQPRTLNTRLLSRLAAPMLADHSLPAMAKWLGLDGIDERRTALQEAKLTAEIFLKLVPLLRNLEIRTLAQAEMACRSFAAEADHLLPPEWKLTEAKFQKSALNDETRERIKKSSIDSFLYQKRNKDLMTSPPFIVSGTMPLSEVLDVLLTRRISSVFIKTEQSQADHSKKETDKTVYGILTERDIIRALRVNAQAGLQMPVSHFMNAPLKTVHQDAFAYRSLGRMQRLNIRHLGVVDDEGHLTGVLTPKDLVLKRAFRALQIGDGIEQAETVEALGRVWAEMPFLVHCLLAENMEARDIAPIISREVCAMTRKASYFAEMRMLARGRGRAPSDYCVLVLGSAGRGESLLALEQDYAIIYNGKLTHDVWFEELAGHLSEILNSVGILPCQNRIMANYPEWRKTTEDWKKTIQGWMEKTDPRDLINVDIFFDARPVYGNLHLGKGLLNEAYGLAVNMPRFQKMLATISGNMDVALNFLGKLKRQGGRVDLKSGGLVGITAAARVLALRYNILNRSTKNRIAALKEQDDLSSGDLETVDMAHRYLMSAILEQQLEDLAAGKVATNRVDIKRLDVAARKKIIWALRQTEKIKLAVAGMEQVL